MKKFSKDEADESNPEYDKISGVINLTLFLNIILAMIMAGISASNFESFSQGAVIYFFVSVAGIVGLSASLAALISLIPAIIIKLVKRWTFGNAFKHIFVVAYPIFIILTTLIRWKEFMK